MSARNRPAAKAARRAHRCSSKTAVALIGVRAILGEPGTRTYVAVAAAHSANLALALGDGELPWGTEELPWSTLPGIRQFAIAALSAQSSRSVILGTAEGHAWVTWHLPVEPPPLPAEHRSDHDPASTGKRGKPEPAADFQPATKKTGTAS